MADDEHMENALRTEVHEAVAASQNSILSEIRSLISTEMHTFGEKQKEIADAQISINLRQNVQQQIEHSGVLPGSHLHSLSSKMSEYHLASKSDNTVKSY
ncbi:hypothetical protein FSP39_002133 [Pinctada imbricata]|uniref:Uncharacterized protein n=1 Tax=Pinctada imbricata TaxID=66713 RepID=A0AA89C2Z7_PINIB|nr:hypothetical protein FSP39_002133 [Pinctada imbricata]